MSVMLEGPKVRAVRSTEECLRDALNRALDAERAIGQALLGSPTNAHSLRIARALASSLADELQGLLGDSGAPSEVRLRAGASSEVERPIALATVAS